VATTGEIDCPLTQKRMSVLELLSAGASRQCARPHLVWQNLQVAKGGQGAYKSSKVRMKIAPHSGLLFILFLLLWHYKH